MPGPFSLAKALGIANTYEAKPYEYDESAFVDPYREENKAMLDAEKEMARGREIDRSNADAARLQQMQLSGALMNQAMGQGPSIAEAQLRSGMDRNLAQANALMASNAGVNPALAARQVGMGRALAGQQLAQDAAAARLQEQQMAAQTLGGVLGQMRGQDIQVIGQETNLQALNDQMVRAFTEMGLSLDQAQFLANQRLQELMGQQHMGAQQINAGIAGQNAQAGTQLLGGLLGAGATLGSAAML